MIEILKLDKTHSDILANILSYDRALHKILSPSQAMTLISGEEYYTGCIEWKKRKNGCCYTVLIDDVPIGSISYTHKAEDTAAVGAWIKSDLWNHGNGTRILSQFKGIVKAEGYKYLAGSILKSNPRSKRMCEKCGAVFTEDMDRWYPIFEL